MSVFSFLLFIEMSDRFTVRCQNIFPIAIGISSQTVIFYFRKKEIENSLLKIIFVLY